MAEVIPCPSNHRLEQFLGGRLVEAEVKQLDRHLAQCETCLQSAVALKADDGVVQALRLMAQTATGTEKDSLIAWIIERLKSPAGDGKTPAPPFGQATRPIGKSTRPVHDAPPPEKPVIPIAEVVALNNLVPPPPASSELPPGLAPFLAPAQGAGEMGRLGPYRLLKVLGKGGMGMVFLAEDQQLKRQVAIKVLLPAALSADEARLRFLHEAQATAVIENDHVIPIYHVGEERGLPYLVMPFLKGEPLEKRLESGRPIPLPDLLRLGREIAWGLDAAHQQGLIHRDIKPANIWLEAPSSRVKILDFGLARAVAQPVHLTQTGYVLGTPAYMAPEQARGQPVDHTCDLFSLGVVLYRMATGIYPFKGETTMALLSALAMDTPTPVTELNPGLPQEFADLVTQLLAKDSAARPPSAQAVAERIQAIEQAPAGAPQKANVGPVLPDQRVRSKSATVSDGPTGELAGFLQPPHNQDLADFTAFTSPLRNREQRPAVRKRLLAALLAVLAVVAMIGFFWWYNSPGRPTSPKEQTLTGPTGDGTKKVVPVANGGQRPVKVFLLAGQNDMGGSGAIKTIDWLGKDPQYGSLLQKIKHPDGSWVVRDNVWVYYPRENRNAKQGNLTVGYGQQDHEIGPELVFGHVMGDYSQSPVLLIKITQGVLSLAVEGRPPSSGGPGGPFYQRLIQTVRKVMMNLKAYYPGYEDQGCEIAGFVWFQGWNDMIFADRLPQYESNLVNLIRDIRKDLGAPNLPVVIGEMGVDGKKANASILAFRKAQAAAVNRPEFQGNVALVKTSAYWDEQADALFRKGYNQVTNKWVDDDAKNQFEPMGSQMPFLYFGSGKINALIGQGFGEAMKGLCATQAGANTGNETRKQ